MQRLYIEHVVLLRSAVSFFACAVKSKEPWTDKHQKKLREVLDATSGGESITVYGEEGEPPAGKEPPDAT